LNSSATVSEAGQNMICAYLSVALLVGLLLNALAGWWWAADRSFQGDHVDPDGTLRQQRRACRLT
jgi:hypothetical protein